MQKLVDMINFLMKLVHAEKNLHPLSNYIPSNKLLFRPKES